MFRPKPLHFAIVDEVDLVLIDEGRNPLLISGEMDPQPSWLLRTRRIIYCPRGGVGSGWVINPHTQWGTYAGNIMSLESVAGGPQRWTEENLVLDVQMPLNELRERWRRQDSESQRAGQPEQVPEEPIRPEATQGGLRTPPLRTYSRRTRMTARKSTVRRPRSVPEVPAREAPVEEVTTMVVDTVIDAVPISYVLPGGSPQPFTPVTPEDLVVWRA